ncbi:MAG: helix-turn-helix domain-containing protein [Fibrobacteres bacterium]|nr:helix-turn-helix domain-containing protein [Fibrobacterota bacterium]
MDTSIQVKTVYFYVLYYDFAPSSEYLQRDSSGIQPRLIAQVSKPPYEVFWDCADIPDQDVWRFFFYCTIEDTKGQIHTDRSATVRHLVLDRHSEFSKASIESHYTSATLKIDASFGDWPTIKPINFMNNNNLIETRTMWDENFLYLAIVVHDENLRGQRNNSIPARMFDCITLKFDMNHSRSHIQEQDDRGIAICVNDTLWGLIEVPDGSTMKATQFLKTSLIKVRCLGTLNNDKDKDTGFIVEAALSWADLGKISSNNDSIGFDVFNTDNDYGKVWRIGKGFSGTELYNNANPTEWGTLVLTGKPKIKLTMLILIALLVTCMIFIIVSKKQKKSTIPSQQVKATKSSSEILTERICDYVKTNYSNPQLSLDILASGMNLSSTHIRKTLKAVLNQGFSEYLAEVRIGKAKEMLLKDKSKNITQIAYECGFNSSEYFTKTFKNLNQGYTPSDFRNTNS